MPRKKKVKKKASVKRGSKVSLKKGGDKEYAVALVRVVSILAYILAVLTIIMGVILFLGGLMGGAIIQSMGVDTILRETAKTNPIDAVLVPLILGSVVLGGLLLIILGVFEIYVAKGLWSGKNWARLVTIVVSIVWLISALIQFDIIAVVVSILILGLLMLSRSARAHFGK